MPFLNVEVILRDFIGLLIKVRLFLLRVTTGNHQGTMRKEKNIEKALNESPKSDFDSHSLETDQEILDQINKRKEENQALKKLLENLNTSFPKQEAKS